MCRHVCPVGCVTQLETFTPHGWGLIIASVQRGLLEWNQETVEDLYTCADCGTCQAHCVTDQPLPTAISMARAEVFAQNLAPSKVAELDHALQTWGNPYQPKTPNPVNGKGDFALFVGDTAQYLGPEALQSALKLLEAVDVKPVLIGIGRNSGYLASSLGLLDTAKSLAKNTIDELEACGAVRLFVLSPGDYYTFDKLYPERLGTAIPKGVELIEVTTYLAEQMEIGAIHFTRSEEPYRFAYVDPTHAVRVPHRHHHPRKLLAAVMTGECIELFWRQERTHPVGNTALQFTRPAIADKLTHARLEDARQSGARVLFTDDPGTLHTLREKVEEYGLRIYGLYEWLAGHLIHA